MESGKINPGISFTISYIVTPCDTEILNVDEPSHLQIVCQHDNFCSMHIFCLIKRIISGVIRT